MSWQSYTKEVSFKGNQEMVELHITELKMKDMLENQWRNCIQAGLKLVDKDKGIKVRPEHIHECLREFAGIAAHPHAKKFPLGLPEKEKLKGLWG